MSLYFWILIGSISGPFLLSFDKKVHFYTTWKYLFPATIAVAAAFIVWDEFFTQWGIWGFTDKYLQGIYLGHLPLEECLFFVIVPYACVFIYEVLKAYFPTVKLKSFSHYFAIVFTLAGLILGAIFSEKAYTTTACLISAMLTIGIYFVYKAKWYGNFVFAFLVAIVPFLIVNGILTGGFTPDPVVWYNPDHNMGFRVFTIPFEDLFYNYCMLFPIVGFYEWLKSKGNKNRA